LSNSFPKDPVPPVIKIVDPASFAFEISPIAVFIYG
jgi:hypothetical protein